MKPVAGLIKYLNNTLLFGYWDKKVGKHYVQRKRLPNTSSPFVKEVQRKYITSSVKAIAFIKQETKMSLRDSYNLFCEFREGRQLTYKP